MLEQVKRVLIALALGLLVALVCNYLDLEFHRLGIPTASTYLNDLIVGLVAAVSAYAWASFIAERHLHQASAEKLRQEAVLRERTRIACEIHDTLAQCFAGMIVNLEAASEFLGESTEGRKFSDRALRMGKEGLAEARTLLRGLRTPNCQASTFREAVIHMVETLTGGANLRVNCAIDEIPPTLSPDTEAQILRIVREAVTNVVRHANASNVRVTLHAKGNEIQFCVEDDGLGFSPDESHNDGNSFGLSSMRERAKELGGFLWVYTQPEKGTQVVAFVPISSPANEGAVYARESPFDSHLDCR